MKHSLSLAAAALLLATGCGQTRPDTAGSHASAGSRPAAEWVGTCSATDQVITRAAVVARVDLDGDGSPEDVRRTVLDATGCPDYLFARVGDRFVGSPLGGISPGRQGFSTVKVPGRDSEIVVVHTTHPRGGFETHLFGYADGLLNEIRDAKDNPPIPFVATDTGGGYVSATCGDNSVVVRQAVRHQPPGAARGWDVVETTYRLHGTTATTAGQHKIKADVPSEELATSYPALVRRAMFTSGCPG